MKKRRTESKLEGHTYNGSRDREDSRLKNKRVSIGESLLSLNNNLAVLGGELKDVLLFDAIDVDSEGCFDGWVLLDFNTN